MGGDGALTGEGGSVEGGLSLRTGQDKAKCFLTDALEEWWHEGRKEGSDVSVGEYVYFALRSHGYFIRESRVSAAASLAYLLLNSWVASHLKSLLAETPSPTLHVPAPWLPIMPELVFPKPTPPPLPVGPIPLKSLSEMVWR